MRVGAVKLRAWLGWLLLGAAPVRATVPADVLFHASWDTGLAADVAAGGGEATPQGGLPVLVAGRLGQGLRVGAENGWLRYPALGNLRPNRGTVAFWVQPVDWSGDDDEFRVWFQAIGMIVYKYGSRQAALSFYRGPASRRVSWIWQPIPGWQPSQWHHLAATWDDDGLAFHADGELVGRTVGLDPLPEPTGSAILAVGPKDGWGGAKHSVLDELFVFRRALTATEVRENLSRGAPPADLPRITVGDAVPPPAIDGGLNEAGEGAWGWGAAAVTGFVSELTGELAERQTTLWLTRDAARLYLGLRAADRLTAAVTIRLKPPGGALREWSLDAAGRFLKGEPAQCRATNLGAAWEAELALPLDLLGRPPAAGEVWGLNVSRTLTGPRETTAWVAGGGLGELIFDADAPLLRLTGLGPLRHGRCEPLIALCRRGAGTVELALEAVRDDGQSFPLVRESPPMGGVPPWQQVLKLAPRAAVPEDTVSLRLELRDAKSHAVAAKMSWPFSFVPPLRVDLDWLPFDRVVMARVAAALADPAEPATVRLRLRSPGSAKVLAEASVPLVAGYGVARLDTAKVPEGAYEVAAEWLSAERLCGATVVPFQRKAAPSWEAARKIGTEAAVLPPWEPVSTGARALGCWNRTYRMGGLGLPEQIESAGEPLLSRPVTLKVRAAGRDLAWQGKPWRVVESGPVRAVGRSEQAAGGLRLTVTASLDYDGLLLYALSLTAGRPVLVDAVTLEVPLRAKHARLSSATGRTPEGTGRVWHSKFTNYHWLGDYDRGLAWAAESDGAWRPAEADSAICVDREPQTVTLRLDLVGRPETWRGTRTFRFALQATPVRPLVKGWRRVALRGNSDFPPPSLISIWHSQWSGPTAPSFSYPQPRDEQEFAALVRAWQSRGFQVAPYQSLTDLAANSPEARWYDGAWQPTEDPLSQGERSGLVEPRGRQVCTGSGWADFLVWSLRDLVARNGLDGVYLDNIGPALCRNPRHHHADLADLPDHPARGIFATRELLRRIRTVYAAAGRPSAIWTSSKPLACWAFGDVFCHGEGLNFAGAKSLDEQQANLDQLMANLNGKQLGLVGFLLPGIYNDKVYGAPGYTEALLSVCLLCDIPVWPIWCNGSVVSRTYRPLCDWGYQDAEFVGYWNLAGKIRCAAPGIAVSLYRDQRRALLVVTNLDVTDFDGQVSVDWTALGLAPGGAGRDLLGGQAVPVTDGVLALTVPTKNFRLIAVGG